MFFKLRDLKILWIIGIVCILISSKLNCQNKTNVILENTDLVKEDSKRLMSLDTLTNKMIEENHPLQFKYLDSTISLAKELNNWDMVVSKSRFIIQDLIYKNQQEEAYVLIDQLLSNKSKFKSKTSVAHILLKRAGILYYKNELKKALIDYAKASDLFHEAKNFVFEADAIFFSGQVYTDLGNFAQAVMQYQKAYTLYQKVGDFEYMLLTKENSAILYSKNDMAEKAIEEHNEVINLALEKKHYRPVVVALVNKAIIYRKQGNYIAASNLINRSRVYMDSLNSEVNFKRLTLMTINLENMYHSLLHLNSINKAEEYLKEAMSYRKQIVDPDYYNASFLLAQADIYIAKNESGNAIKSLSEIISKGYKNPDITDLIKAEKLIATAYIKQNDHKNAFLHQSAYDKLKDSVSYHQRHNKYLYYQAMFEAEQEKMHLKNQINNFETTINNFKKPRYIKYIILFCILIALSILFITKVYKKRLHTISCELEKNKNQFSNYTKKLVVKNMPQSLKATNEGNAIENVENIDGNKIKILTELTNFKILTSSDWLLFKEKFSILYPSFYVILKQNMPYLTESEMRLLSLKKLNLSNAEMSNILGISVNSVITGNYRLRKKLSQYKNDEYYSLVG